MFSLAFFILLLFGIFRLTVNGLYPFNISTFSWSLANKFILIDPGHGGVDPGAVGKNEVLEKDIVLAVGHRLAAYLRQGGARVMMTREEDTDLSDPEITGLYAKKKQDLARRVALANHLQVDLMLSIHVNSFPDTNVYGGQAFYQPERPASQKLAVSIQEELNRLIKNNDRVPLPNSHYYLMRQTKVPAVIVEVGFISNPRELLRLQNPAYQSKLAWSIYTGIVKHFYLQKNQNTIN
ncbi:MAG TPA: N-acetylmuramoyl-L-alanine amidase CwlD [Desulfotomaculum sp.]|nr:N-acetylmuramoyl-L-alanine amidase CwlD [Desulfotomaculum sp.]